MTIYFYRVNDKYGCFSNFSSHSFELRGKLWSTSEHFFQAMKFEGTDYEEQIRLAPTPMEAAHMGRDRKRPIRSDWEEVKDEVMKEALMQKFLMHKDIRDILLSTDTEEIIEKTTSDYYWGCGADGTGLNKLGKILMEVRYKLQKI